MAIIQVNCEAAKGPISIEGASFAFSYKPVGCAVGLEVGSGDLMKVTLIIDTLTSGTKAVTSEYIVTFV